MAFIVKDRVRDTTTTTGTATITLSGTAPLRYRNFASVLAVNDTFPYAIVHQSVGVDEWEVGIGTLNSSTTFTRTTILAGTNGTSAVVFSAGTKDVMLVDYANTLPFRTITGATNKISVTAGDGVASNPLIDVSPGADSTGSVLNATLTESHAASAATFALKTRSGTDPSSTDTTVAVFSDGTSLVISAALSVTIPSGATMGALNGVPFRLWLCLINDGGTPRIGVRQCSTMVANTGFGTKITAFSGFPPYGTLSSTVMNTSSDNAGVTYTDVAVTTDPYVVLGYADYDSGLTTAGTWAVSPSRIVNYGPGIPLPGQFVQTVRLDDGGFVGSGTTQIPRDNTIPQNTEGDQYQSLAITPLAAQNILSVASQGIFGAGTTDSAAQMALFMTGSANAIALSYTQLTGASTGRPATITAGKRLLAGVTSALTFTMRAGGTGATLEYNSISAAASFGGVYNSFMDIQEMMG